MTLAPQPLFKLGYRPELDGLRAIAVVSVLCAHAALIGSGADLLGEKMPTDGHALRGGLFGVDIFFVLSGFLITALLMQEHAVWRQIDFKAFYVRRILRLSPAMVLTLAGSSIYLALAGGRSGDFDWLAILYSALYVSNFALIFGGLRLGMLSPTWSLSVEEQFYSVWPFIISKLVKLPRPSILKIIAAAIVATWILRAILHAAAWKYMYWPYFGAANHLIFARADGLLCGALVAMAATWGLLPDPARYSIQLKAVAWFCAATLGAILHYGPGLQDNGLYGPSIFYFFYAYVSIAAALLILVLMISPPKPMLTVLRWPPILWTGKVSYGLYIFHLPIFALTSVGYFGRTAAVIVAFAVTFAVAAASYHLIEKKFLSLRATLGLPRAAKAAKAERESDLAQKVLV